MVIHTARTSKLLLVVFLCSLFFSSQSESASPIKMGFFSLPPHHCSQSENSKPTGAGIEYFEALASKTGDTVKWVGPFPVLRLFQKLESGEVDGTIGLSKKSQYNHFLYYIKTPMFFAKPILVVRKDNSLTEIKPANNLKGWCIGMIVSKSGSIAPFIDDNRDLFTIEPICCDRWAESNLKKLFIGRIDAVFDRNQFTLPFVAAKMKMHSQIKVFNLPDPPTPMYVTFSKASERGRILTEKCNAVLPLLDLDYEQMVQREINAVVNQKQKEIESLETYGSKVFKSQNPRHKVRSAHGADEILSVLPIARASLTTEAIFGHIAQAFLTAKYYLRGVYSFATCTKILGCSHKLGAGFELCGMRILPEPPRLGFTSILIRLSGFGERYTQHMILSFRRRG